MLFFFLINSEDEAGKVGKKHGGVAPVFNLGSTAKWDYMYYQGPDPAVLTQVITQMGALPKAEWGQKAATVGTKGEICQLPCNNGHFSDKY